MDNLKIGNIELNPTNLELLRLAKELAYSDYNNRKAELHNQWLKESDLAWRLHRAKVTYPSIPDFPSEQDIVNRAINLINFLNTPRPDLEKNNTETKIEKKTEEVPSTEVSTEVKEDVQTVTPQVVEQPMTQSETKNTKKSLFPPEEDLTYAKLKIQRRQGDDNNKELVGSLIKKLSEIKNAWK